MSGKNTLTRVLVLLLAFVMVLSVLGMVSCADTGKDDKKKGNKGEKQGGDEDRIELDLPDVSYMKDGEPAEFHVLEWFAGKDNWVGSNWIPWGEVDAGPDDADQIGKAVYERNSAVEEKYDIEITQEYAAVDGDFFNLVLENFTTGDNLYRMITYRTLNVGSHITMNYMLDLNDYADSIFHFDQPWWVQDSVRSYTLGEHLYCASSEMLLRDKGATAAVSFNQEMMTNNGYSISELYEMVENKEWTLEECEDMCSVVSHDMDDGLMNSAEDIWGVEAGDDPVFYLFNSSGHKFAHIDDDGRMVWDFGEDQDSTAILKDIFDNFMYQDWNLNYYNVNRSDADRVKNPFKNGHCLFRFHLIKTVASELRDMVQDYGVLPMPLYEAGKDYHSLVWEHHDCVLTIPNVGSPADAEMSATIIEALSWEGYYTVSPVFYGVILEDRSTRDDESKAMVQKILDSRSFDPGQYWDGLGSGTGSGLFGDYDPSSNRYGLLRLSKSGGESGIAAIWDRYKDACLGNVDKINEKFFD